MANSVWGEVLENNINQFLITPTNKQRLIYISKLSEKYTKENMFFFRSDKFLWRHNWGKWYLLYWWFNIHTYGYTENFIAIFYNTYLIKHVDENKWYMIDDVTSFRLPDSYHISMIYLYDYYKYYYHHTHCHQYLYHYN